MHTTHNQRRQVGFTLVELIIVIVIIAILAAVTVVAYNAIGQSAANTAIKSDLNSISDDVQAVSASTQGIYPATLPADVANAVYQNVTISYSTATYPHYSNIDEVQNGVLLSQICANLVSSGQGQGLNSGGGTDAYITGCGNWNHGSMQVTGWTSQVFNTPVNDTTFTNYAAAVPAGDSYHPNEQSVVQKFYTSLHDLLIIEGGHFPITTFWDSWATPTNGGVQQESLPTQDSTGAGSTYCVQATSTSYPSLIWHVENGGVALSGSC
jgi:prepilin-type N-terminal cleavage/methylation domain-containing protein